MNYEIYGPFELPRVKSCKFDRSAGAKRDFWESVDYEQPGLTDACGCYLFSVRNRVWYVGRAEKQSFRKECFTPDKVLKINDAMDGATGVAHLTLIARATKSGEHFAKPGVNGHRDIQDLELLLIGVALERNARLLNFKSTKVLREIVVPGFIRSQKGTGNSTSVKAFRRILGI